MFDDEDDDDGGLIDGPPLNELDDQCKCGHAFELHYDDGDGCCLVHSCNCLSFTDKD